MPNGLEGLLSSGEKPNADVGEFSLLNASLTPRKLSSIPKLGTNPEEAKPVMRVLEPRCPLAHPQVLPCKTERGIFNSLAASIYSE